MVGVPPSHPMLRINPTSKRLTQIRLRQGVTMFIREDHIESTGPGVGPNTAVLEDLFGFARGHALRHAEAVGLGGVDTNRVAAGAG